MRKAERDVRRAVALANIACVPQLIDDYSNFPVLRRRTWR